MISSCVKKPELKGMHKSEFQLTRFRLGLKLALISSLTSSLLISIFYSYPNLSYYYKPLMIFQNWRSIINTWHTHPIIWLMFYGYWSIRTVGWKLSTLSGCSACPCNDMHNQTLHALPELGSYWSATLCFNHQVVYPCTCNRSPEVRHLICNGKSNFLVWKCTFQECR